MVRDRPLRVAVDLTPVLPGAANGGAKLFAMDLVRGMGRQAPDWEFVMLTSATSDAELAVLDAPNVRRRCVRGEPASSGGTAAELRLKAVRLLCDSIPMPLLGTMIEFARNAQRRFRPSRLLASLGMDLLFSPLAGIRFFDPRVPVVTVIHDLQYQAYPQFFQPMDILYRHQYFLETCRLATRIVCVSDFVRETVLACGRVPAERAVTIYPVRFGASQSAALPTHSNVLTVLGLSAGEYLLYPANAWPHKNHRMLLIAFGMYHTEHPESMLKLVCTGAPDQRMQLLAQDAERMGLGPWTVFPGYVATEDFGGLLQSCLAVIFPSLYEGFGMPIIEAMAHGKPVLCSNRTSLPEVAGDAALYFDPRQPEDICQAIGCLASNHVPTTSLREAGLRRASGFGHLDRMPDLYLGVLRNAARRSQYPGAPAT